MKEENNTKHPDAKNKHGNARTSRNQKEKDEDTTT